MRGMRVMSIKSDRQRALEFLQLFPVDVLASAARGEIDIDYLARVELANRGMDQNGEWVGFEEARRKLGVV